MVKKHLLKKQLLKKHLLKKHLLKKKLVNKYSFKKPLITLNYKWGICDRGMGWLNGAPYHFLTMFCVFDILTKLFSMKCFFDELVVSLFNTNFYRILILLFFSLFFVRFTPSVDLSPTQSIFSSIIRHCGNFPTKAFSRFYLRNFK